MWVNTLKKKKVGLDEKKRRGGKKKINKIWVLLFGRKGDAGGGLGGAKGVIFKRETGVHFGGARP